MAISSKPTSGPGESVLAHNFGVARDPHAPRNSALVDLQLPTPPKADFMTERPTHSYDAKAKFGKPRWTME
jgi:hypothetical protein